MHQLEQYPSIHLGGRGSARLDAEMQDHEAVARQTDEYRHTDWAPRLVDRENRLYAADVTHAYGQDAVMLLDLGHAIGFDGLLNAHPHPVLVGVEEQELFQRDS